MDLAFNSLHYPVCCNAWTRVPCKELNQRGMICGFPVFSLVVG
jgi:hypothetical protein